MGRLNLRSPNAFRMTPALVQGIPMIAPISKLRNNEMELPLLHLWATRPDHPLTSSKAACLVILTKALDWLHGFYDPDVLIQKVLKIFKFCLTLAALLLLYS